MKWTLQCERRNLRVFLLLISSLPPKGRVLQHTRFFAQEMPVPRKSQRTPIHAKELGGQNSNPSPKKKINLIHRLALSLVPGRLLGLIYGFMQTNTIPKASLRTERFYEKDVLIVTERTKQECLCFSMTITGSWKVVHGVKLASRIAGSSGQLKCSHSKSLTLNGQEKSTEQGKLKLPGIQMKSLFS